MKRNTFVCIGLVSFFLSYCGHQADRKNTNSSENVIVQQEDGTVSLKLENAICYSDVTNPASNTAEWNFSISKPGRYKVWLSSATRDTLNLSYANSVKISLLDNQVEVVPACDKIVQNSEEISYPYFRADSFIGSLYIQDTGQFYVQVTSEMILPKDYNAAGTSAEDITRLISVSFTPVIIR